MKKTICLLASLAMLFGASCGVFASDSVIEDAKLNEYDYTYTETAEEISLDDYELASGADESELTAAVTYKSVKVEPGNNIMIFNTNNRSISIKTDGACQYIVYDANGKTKTMKEIEKGNRSISVGKNCKAYIANSGTSTLTVKCDERYFNEYKEGFGLLYIDYSISAGQSIKLSNKENISAKITVESLPDTYAFIRYKNTDRLLSGGKWKTNKSINVNKGETVVITNESDNRDMVIHYSLQLLDRSGSSPAYEEKKLVIGSQCKVRNNTSQSLKYYAKNFSNKKQSRSVKAGSTSTIVSKNFGVYIYVPNGFMSFE